MKELEKILESVISQKLQKGAPINSQNTLTMTEIKKNIRDQEIIEENKIVENKN